VSLATGSLRGFKYFIIATYSQTKLVDSKHKPLPSAHRQKPQPWNNWIGPAYFRRQRLNEWSKISCCIARQHTKDFITTNKAGNASRNCQMDILLNYDYCH